MKFEPEKVLTALTKYKAKEGDWGWFGDNEQELLDVFGMTDKLQELIGVRECSSSSSIFPFVTKDDTHLYFYPVTYEYLQMKWVEENDIEVGDNIRVVRGWKEKERGFCVQNTVDPQPVGAIGSIKHIKEYYIYIENKNGNSHLVPYFAIEKVKEPTYEEMQAKWVEKNNLKVGDKIRIVKSWSLGEKGFKGGYIDSEMVLGKECVVDHILEYSIASGCLGFPYFAIEKITEKYRPFASAEEFSPYRDEWWKHKYGVRVFNLREYGDFGVSENDYDDYTYEEFFESFVFADTGEPAGVKI